MREEDLPQIRVEPTNRLTAWMTREGKEKEMCPSGKSSSLCHHLWASVSSFFSLPMHCSAFRHRHTWAAPQRASRPVTSDCHCGLRYSSVQTATVDFCFSGSTDSHGGLFYLCSCSQPLWTLPLLTLCSFLINTLA